MLEFRRFERSDEDFATVVAVFNVIWPDRLTTAELERFRDEQRNPKYFFARFFVQDGPQVIGLATIGESAWSHRDGKYFVFAELIPGRETEFQRVLEFLTGQIQERGFNHLVFWTRDDKLLQIENVTKIGAENTMRQPITELDLVRFDPSAWQPSRDKAVEDGYIFRSHSELNHSGFDWRPAQYEMELELWQDVPYTDTIVVKPFEEWLKEYEESPDYRAEMNFLAFEGDRMIGMSHTYRDLGSPERLFTGLTGVRRDHRRKGIATALKVTCLDTCKKLGYKTVETDNEEKNPMLDLNLALGFRKVHEWMQFELKFDSIQHRPLAPSG